MNATSISFVLGQEKELEFFKQSAMMVPLALALSANENNAVLV